MSITASLTTGGLSEEQFDLITRKCQNDIAILPGVDIVAQQPAPSSGRRGDPITLGCFTLALVTSGAVTALFAILKSYIERGIDGSFEGLDGNGKPIKLSLKGASLEQFKDFLSSAGALK
jgi:hypothetical protein